MHKNVIRCRLYSSVILIINQVKTKHTEEKIPRTKSKWNNCVWIVNQCINCHCRKHYHNFIESKYRGISRMSTRDTNTRETELIRIEWEFGHFWQPFKCQIECEQCKLILPMSSVNVNKRLFSHQCSWTWNGKSSHQHRKYGEVQLNGSVWIDARTNKIDEWKIIHRTNTNEQLILRSDGIQSHRYSSYECQYFKETVNRSTAPPFLNAMRALSIWRAPVHKKF